MLYFASERGAKRLPIPGQASQWRATNWFPGQLTEDREGWGRAREESPARLRALGLPRLSCGLLILARLGSRKLEKAGRD